jgi:hypothetical protein
VHALLRRPLVNTPIGDSFDNIERQEVADVLGPLGQSDRSLGLQTARCYLRLTAEASGKGPKPPAKQDPPEPDIAPVVRFLPSASPKFAPGSTPP